ncbi:MAG TPA: hypothetical protein QGH10_14605 [Armatimonadota bacterium]|nr:hypothetical protein [Armatimonadota bacterium]
MLALIVAIAIAAETQPASIVILRDSIPATGVASDPGEIADVLSREGHASRVVAAEELAEPGLLDPGRTDLVVLPYGGSFPAVARDAFAGYVRDGGSFLNVGGLAFSRLMAEVNGEWTEAGSVHPDDDKAYIVADLERDDVAGWSLNHASDAAAITLDTVAPGASQSTRAASLSCSNLDGWAYAGLEAGVASPSGDHTVLSFWAKGDADTTLLAVEPRETDGSRWKKVVRLTGKWQRFLIPASEFLSYASETRGGPGDGLAVDRIASLWFGFTKGMVGGGRHRLRIDEIAWAPLLAETGPPVAPLRPDADADLTVTAFGDLIKAPAPAEDVIPVYVPVRRVEAGPDSGYAALAPVTAPSPRGDMRIGGPGPGRLIPLAHDGSAAIYLPKDRPTAVWALFGADRTDVVTDGGLMVRMLDPIARMAAGAPLLNEPTLRFVADPDPNAEVAVGVRGADIPARGLALHVTPRRAGDEPGPVSAIAPVPIEGDTASVRIPLSLLGPRGWELRLTLYAGERQLDSVTVTSDPERSLVDLCDWLVEKQKDDGSFSGIAFQDNRAVRGLLGAYEIAGERAYVQSAIRWGEETIRLQREDGGYRMGYGMSSKGEACYVADGGEIAIAMARLTTYVKGKQRKRFVDSLRGYFAYREGFREDNGAIGVGWCMHDYGQRPVVPLESPTRIFAGEMNAYTIGCTLAAASAYARITEDAADLTMSRNDADWLLEHYTSLSGAAAESACWAHHFTATDEQKARIETHMRDSFRKRLINPADTSWLAGGGRSVLDLDMIAYWLANIDSEDAEMQAAFARWTYALCGSNSTSNVRHLLEAEDLNQTEWRFLCFAATALADAAQPMVTMRDM